MTGSDLMTNVLSDKVTSSLMQIQDGRSLESNTFKSAECSKHSDLLVAHFTEFSVLLCFDRQSAAEHHTNLHGVLMFCCCLLVSQPAEHVWYLLAFALCESLTHPR